MTGLVAETAPPSAPIETRAPERSDDGQPPATSSVIEGWCDSWRWPVVRIAAFFVCTVILAFPRVDRLHTSIVGDPGDAYLILSLLEWGGDRSVNLFQDFWSGPMFASGENVMAYSDTLLPLTFPFWVLELLTGSRILAYNLLFLVSWVICAESTYHLAMRLIKSRSLAALAAVAFTFSTIRLAQAHHFQLAWSCLVPLSLLLLFRFREAPSVRRGIAAGLVIVAQMLISAYHGVILLAFTGVLAVVGFAIAARRGDGRLVLPGYAALLASIGLIMLPIQNRYTEARSEVRPRDTYPEWAELRLGDWRSPAPTARLARSLPLLDTPTAGRFPENYAYVGLLVIVLVPVLLVLAAHPRWRHRLPRLSFDWIALGALGVGATLLAVGKGPILGIHMPFWDIAGDVIPGFSSMVAIVRLFVFAQLFLVLAAVAALRGLLVNARLLMRLVVVASLGALVVLDSLQTHTVIEVADAPPGSVYDVMATLDPGTIVELPMAPQSTGILYAFTESTRMVLSSNDALQSVNGYSGYAPIDYESTTQALNSFPAPESIDELRRLDIDYIAIHTAPIDTGLDGVSASINGAAGIASWPPSDLEDRLAAVPPGIVAERIDATDGVVLVLASEITP